MLQAAPAPTPRYSPAARGVACAATAYLLWGFLPLYFHALGGRTPTLLILSHRVVWSVLILSLLLTFLGQWPQVRDVLRSKRTVLMMAFSTLMISSNWAIFTYVTTHHQVTQAALGYFLTPIWSALLGYFVLRERLRPLQWTAVAVATAGVCYFAYAAGVVPKEALALAFTWGLYGLTRKLAPVDAVAGLTIETLALLPFALFHLIFSAATNAEGGRPDPLLLFYLAAGGGIFTTVPLLFFSRATKLLRLSTLGFLQYIGPTCQLLCAVYLGEPLTPARLLAFALIWTAVALFLTDALRRYKTPGSPGVAAPHPPAPLAPPTPSPETTNTRP